jgi:Protein of unknown function (DUF3016)
MHTCKAFGAALAAALFLSAAAAHAAGKVEVNWIEPAQFSDVGRGSIDREQTLKALTEHLALLARQLPDGQILKLDVTDVNLAGELSPNLARDFRILRGRADWPAMELKYELSAEGRSIKSGSVRLSDMGYMFKPTGDYLGYEKRMIDTWFKTEFSPSSQP